MNRRGREACNLLTEKDKLRRGGQNDDHDGFLFCSRMIVSSWQRLWVLVTVVNAKSTEERGLVMGESKRHSEEYYVRQ